MLAFSSVPPVSVLAPAGSAQPLGKVNANAGWLAHMPPSISVSLAFSLYSYIWSCFSFLFFFFLQIYLLHSHRVWRRGFLILHIPFISIRGKTEVRKVPLEHVLTCSRALQESRERECADTEVWTPLIHLKSLSKPLQSQCDQADSLFLQIPCFPPSLRLLLVIRL